MQNVTNKTDKKPLAKTSCVAHNKDDNTNKMCTRRNNRLQTDGKRREEKQKQLQQKLNG